MVKISPDVKSLKTRLSLAVAPAVEVMEEVDVRVEAVNIDEVVVKSDTATDAMTILNSGLKISKRSTGWWCRFESTTTIFGKKATCHCFQGDYGNRVAKRVHNSSEADIVFVPFFSSLCYNHSAKARPPNHGKDKEVQAKMVKYLEAQDEWKRSGGIDHVIMAHHPNSLPDARNELWPAIYILSDFGRYPSNVANVQKDVIAPYMHVIKSYDGDTSTFDSRTTLLYFQGAIYRKDSVGESHLL